jgi:membrane fusion protein (multidrug efflux system)
MLILKRKLANGRLKKPTTNEAQVHLTLETGETYPLAGILEFSEVSVDPTTGSVVLRTIFPNPDHLLLPGMFVRAQVVEGVAEQALLVPQQGVSRNAKGEAVALIVGDDDTVAQRILTIDRAMGNDWLVSSGLAPGDRLIIEGSQKVRPGQAVAVVMVGQKTDAVTTEKRSGKDGQTPRGGA